MERASKSSSGAIDNLVVGYSCLTDPRARGVVFRVGIGLWAGCLELLGGGGGDQAWSCCVDAEAAAGVDVGGLAEGLQVGDCAADAFRASASWPDRHGQVVCVLHVISEEMACAK